MVTVIPSLCTAVPVAPVQRFRASTNSRLMQAIASDRQRRHPVSYIATRLHDPIRISFVLGLNGMNLADEMVDCFTDR